MTRNNRVDVELMDWVCCSIFHAVSFSLFTKFVAVGNSSILTCVNLELHSWPNRGDGDQASSMAMRECTERHLVSDRRTLPGGWLRQTEKTQSVGCDKDGCSRIG